MPDPLSPRNQHVKRLRRLVAEPRFRRDEGLVVVDGATLVDEMLSGSRQVTDPAGPWPARSVEPVELFVDPDDQKAARIAEDASAAGVPVHRLDRETLGRVSDQKSSQGIVLVVRRVEWALADISSVGIVLCLDGIADPGNAGTLIRTAEAIGAGGVVGASGVDLFSPKVMRASRGGQLRMPLVETTDLAGVLASEEIGPRSVVVADTSATRSIWEADLPRDSFLIVGNETHGVSQEARNRADEVVLVPMPGRTESLNAAVTGAVIMYEWLRRHGA